MRSEHRVPSGPALTLFLTRVRPRGRTRGSVVLTHGAGSPASAIWDLPFGYSVMAALAREGFDCFSVDVRGFGGSTLPAVMSKAAEDAPPAVRAHEVQADVRSALGFVRRTSGHARADLVGWSWGSLVAGLYATTHPSEIRRLVLFAPVFDRRWPSRHRTSGAWRSEDRALHMKWLDPTSEEPRVRHAYVERLFRFSSGNELRLPNGPYRDLYGPDAPLWDPGKVRAPTLVLRGNQDRASLRVHARRLFEALPETSTRAYVEIEGAGHFAFRTKKNTELTRAIVGWIARDPPRH